MRKYPQNARHGTQHTTRQPSLPIYDAVRIWIITIVILSLFRGASVLRPGSLVKSCLWKIYSSCLLLTLHRHERGWWVKNNLPERHIAWSMTCESEWERKWTRERVAFNIPMKAVMCICSALEPWLIYRIFYVKLDILRIPLSAQLWLALNWWCKRSRYLHTIWQQRAHWQRPLEIMIA